MAVLVETESLEDQGYAAVESYYFGCSTEHLDWVYATPVPGDDIEELDIRDEMDAIGEEYSGSAEPFQHYDSDRTDTKPFIIVGWEGLEDAREELDLSEVLDDLTVEDVARKALSIRPAYMVEYLEQEYRSEAEMRWTEAEEDTGESLAVRSVVVSDVFREDLGGSVEPPGIDFSRVDLDRFRDDLVTLWAPDLDTVSSATEFKDNGFMLEKAG